MRKTAAGAPVKNGVSAVEPLIALLEESNFAVRWPLSACRFGSTGPRIRGSAMPAARSAILAGFAPAAATATGNIDRGDFPAGFRVE
jgi:hypothetical protein